MVTPPTVIIITTNYLEFHKLSGSLGHTGIHLCTPTTNNTICRPNKKKLTILTYNIKLYIFIIYHTMQINNVKL